MFAIIKTTDDVRDLPPNFQAVLEWGRISFVIHHRGDGFLLMLSPRMASTVFHHYIAADDASESLAGLKRIHGSMPYFMLKAALKISNPVYMIRSAPLFVLAISIANAVCIGVLDLFMAQPFGGRSLLQRCVD
jgi:hypothetical protein